MKQYLTDYLFGESTLTVTLTMHRTGSRNVLLPCLGVVTQMEDFQILILSITLGGMNSPKVRLYADDTVLHTSVRWALNELLTHFKLPQRLMFDVKLAPNVKETKYMLFKKFKKNKTSCLMLAFLT